MSERGLRAPFSSAWPVAALEVQPHEISKEPVVDFRSLGRVAVGGRGAAQPVHGQPEVGGRRLAQGGGQQRAGPAPRGQQVGDVAARLRLGHRSALQPPEQGAGIVAAGRRAVLVAAAGLVRPELAAGLPHPQGAVLLGEDLDPVAQPVALGLGDGNPAEHRPVAAERAGQTQVLGHGGVLRSGHAA